MMLIKTILSIILALILILILYGFKLCINIDKLATNNNYENNFDKESPRFSWNRLIHFIVIISTVLIISLYFYTRMTIKFDNIFIIFLPQVILGLTVFIHSLLFPKINHEFTWRWSDAHKKHILKLQLEPKQLKLWP